MAKPKLFAYPREFNSKEKLQARFGGLSVEPPYISKHEDVRVRRPNDHLIQDALQKARERFEQDLLLKKQNESAQKEELARIEAMNDLYYKDVEAQRSFIRDQNLQALL